VTAVSPEQLARTALAATIGGLVMVTVVADRLTPPAYNIADQYSTFAAILIVATVVTTLIVSRARLGRPGRLAAVVILIATGMMWYSARLWVHEKEFDYLVAQQKNDLEIRGLELSGDIVNFLRRRARTAPARPQPATWERDEAAVFRYEQETAQLYEEQFAPTVRRIRGMLAQRGLTDRDLDTFARHPSTAFEIGVIAERLAVLSRRIERT
jgi:hypothetical protein